MVLLHLFHSFIINGPCRKQSAGLQTEDRKQHRNFLIKLYLPDKFINKDKLTANNKSMFSSHQINIQQKCRVYHIYNMPKCCLAQISNAPWILCPTILCYSHETKIQNLTIFVTLDYKLTLNFKSSRETQARVLLQGSNTTVFLLPLLS